METGQEFAILENQLFYNQQLADMGAAKILTTQKHTHTYHMWKIISGDDCTWVRFKAYFQEAYLDRKELEQMAGEAGNGSAKNLNMVKWKKLL